jgi:peptidoglycan hydrolase-like protein with peptidoglycan-binding domain
MTTTTAPGASGLRVGAQGPAVLAVEQRLTSLGYWVGAPDGVFDTATAHAVVAFEKLHGLSRDGVVGAQVQAALADAAPPVPRSAAGHQVEIDLTHQVLLVVDSGTVTAVLDVSTGRVAGTTPTGRFTVTRQIDGYHRSDLGVLYRPKYFYEGVAVHGYPSVPPEPASHGCVRTINAAMDWLWASGAMPVGTPVWVYR